MAENESEVTARPRSTDGRTASEIAADPVTPEGTLPGVDGSDNSEKKKRGFPSPLTVLLLVLVGVWVLALILPSGQYQLDDSGAPISGSYEQIDSPLDFTESVQDLLWSPLNGLYGVQDLDTGHVGPFNRGAMFGSGQVFLFILAIGGFMTVVFKTGSLDLGIAHLAKKFSSRGPLLIIVLSVLFGILGSTMSWSDETLGFYALMIPLMLSLGYDRIVTVAVVTVAPFVGSIGSTVNPFRIGTASDAAGISMGDGLILRVLLLVLVMAAVIIYTLRYAAKVKADPTQSLVGHDSIDEELKAQAQSSELAPLSGTDKGVIALLAGTFLLMIFSIIPWGAILNNTAADPITHETITKPFAWELGWWLPELTALFMVMAIVVGAVGRLGEKATTSAFIQGVMDFTGPAFLVAVARGVSVILTNTKTIDTVLNSMEGVVKGRSSIVFVLLLAVVTVPLAFLVGSGSAGMALVMPILAPLGDFAGVDRSLIVTIYNSIGAVLLLVLPTNALLMAGLALARVGFDVYMKFVLPLVGILTAITLGVVLLGTAVS
ncbi:MAG: YfcC family protein [Acidimicrobiales bacterium]|nr:YfcC family protein [Acidimicrobiales bacterium]